jgi:hypothetical protein
MLSRKGAHRRPYLSSHELPLLRIVQEYRLTEVALTARAVEPFDTSMVSNLNIFYKLADRNYYTSTLMATYKWFLDGDRPVSLPGVEIRVADCGTRLSAQLIRSKACESNANLRST